MLGYGWRQLQKPMCNNLAGAQRIKRRANDRLRVMENYLFHEPLRKLKATWSEDRQERLPPKMVASGAAVGIAVKLQWQFNR